jgi:hypothetical protein
MSWEAVTWATKQRMKSSHEQLVLLVLANAADPDGVAFARWPGRDHWWKYLVDLTRLSKSTLFRDINTLIEVGLCARSMIVMSDGTRRPTIQLDLSANFKFDKEHSAHSHTETEPEHDLEETENHHDINDKQDEFSGDEIHSHTETGPTGGNEAPTLIPTGGNDPFPIVGMHKDSSNSCSKESPPTPRGGPSVPDDRFEEFRKAWLRPIERLSVAMSAWDRVPTEKRGEVIAAARGYSAWVGKQRKEPAIVSAQTFLRENSGWGQWLIYTPDASGSSSISTGHPLASLDGKSLVVLHEIAGLDQYLRTIMVRSGIVNYLRPVTPQLLALAQSGPKDDWPALTRQQAAAWEGFLRETVTVQVRNRLKEGSHAPWPWPPRKDGSLSSTGPPEALMTDQDLADFK